MTEVQIAAIAGEHLVAHKIAMLGLVPTLVGQRLRNVDLLVSSDTTPRTLAIQIKSAFHAIRESANAGPDRPEYDLRFPMSRRAITSSSETAFFCFVDLKRLNPAAIPDVYILPAQALRDELENTHFRKYSQLYFERPWQVLQPFRNNWEAIARALTSGSVPTIIESPRTLPTDSLSAHWPPAAPGTGILSLQPMR